MRLLLFATCCLVCLLEPTFVNAQEYLQYAKTKNSAIYRFENREVIVVTNYQEIISGTLFVLNSFNGNYLSVYNARNKTKVRLELNQVQDIMPYNKDKLIALTTQKDSLNQNTIPNVSFSNNKEIEQYVKNFDNQHTIVVLKDSTVFAGRLIHFTKLTQDNYFYVATINLKQRKRIELWQVQTIMPYSNTKLQTFSNNGFKITNYFGSNYQTEVEDRAELLLNQNSGILNVTAMPMDAKGYFGLSIQNSLLLGFKLLNIIEIEMASINNKLLIGESEFFARTKVGTNNKEGINLAYSLTLGKVNDIRYKSVSNFQMIHFSTNSNKQFLSIGIGSAVLAGNRNFNNIGVYSATYGYFIDHNFQIVAESFGVFKHQFYHAMGLRYHINNGIVLDLSAAIGERAYYSNNQFGQEQFYNNSSAMLNLGFKKRFY